MAKHTLTRLASGAAVTAVASLALAAPASAMLPKDPTVDATLFNPSTAHSGTSWELAQIATGALGGVALAGAGIATATGLRQHNRRVAHPV